MKLISSLLANILNLFVIKSPRSAGVRLAFSHSSFISSKSIETPRLGFALIQFDESFISSSSSKDAK